MIIFIPKRNSVVFFILLTEKFGFVGIKSIGVLFLVTILIMAMFNFQF